MYMTLQQVLEKYFIFMKPQHNMTKANALNLQLSIVIFIIWKL